MCWERGWKRTQPGTVVSARARRGGCALASVWAQNRGLSMSTSHARAWCDISFDAERKEYGLVGILNVKSRVEIGADVHTLLCSLTSVIAS